MKDIIEFEKTIIEKLKTSGLIEKFAVFELNLIMREYITSMKRVLNITALKCILVSLFMKFNTKSVP